MIVERFVDLGARRIISMKRIAARQRSNDEDGDKNGAKNARPRQNVQRALNADRGEQRQQRKRRKKKALLFVRLKRKR